PARGVALVARHRWRPGGQGQDGGYALRREATRRRDHRGDAVGFVKREPNLNQERPNPERALSGFGAFCGESRTAYRGRWHTSNRSVSHYRKSVLELIGEMSENPFERDDLAVRAQIREPQQDHAVMRVSVE